MGAPFEKTGNNSFFQMALLYLFLLFSCCVLPCLAASFPFPALGWDWISNLPLLNATQFKDFAYPLVQISANAYRYPVSVPITGWKTASRIAPLAPMEGGAHAILYEEEIQEGINMAASRRLVLAFRGTQIADSLDSLADMCADLILWEDTEFSHLPQKCDLFNESILDYYSQALSYAKRVMDAYSEQPLLLTGHSLGAGLAILVSASLSERRVLPVIGFAPPATRFPMVRRSLHLKALEGHKVFGIAHQWDEVMRTQWDGQVGVLCLYHKPLSLACATCFASGSTETATLLEDKLGCVRSLSENTRSRSTSDTGSREEKLRGKVTPEGSDCLGCFFETHYLKQLVEVVKQGDRPVCEQK